MEVMRYKYIFLIILTISQPGYSKEMETQKTPNEPKAKCTNPKVIEDVFKTNKKTLLNVIKLRIEGEDKDTINERKPDVNHEEQVNNIIASINRIKNNITNDKLKRTNDNDLNEAIILNPNPLKDSVATASQTKTFEKVKLDDKMANLTDHESENQNTNKTNELIESKVNTTYVEIMTIEPNNLNKTNSTSHNIIEILKHLMPMFNSTMTKELHNITVIERDNSRNHSFSEVKNISTIVVTYCDKENFTKADVDYVPETLVYNENVTNFNESLVHDEDSTIEDDDDEDEDVVLTAGEKKDIMEAADYGMKKMHELYSIMEPKLYSMGLWLDDTNPARYVAAFNAPVEESAKYSRYGYASLQAAAKLKQLSGNNNEGVEGRTEDATFPSANALRQSQLIQHCPIRGAPKCPPASKRYRTHDGTCNNLHRTRWGSTMTPVQRFITPSYSDGLQAPRRSVQGQKLPSAREISSLIHENQNVESSGITHLLMQWGQFIDHDVTSSSQSRGFNGSVPRCCKDGGRDFVPREFMHPECMPISVPQSDPFYGPKGVRCLDFVRSSPASHDDCSLGWREQLNQVSAYIDASPIYGSSARKSDKLRLFRNGMLQYGRVQQRRPLLPKERRDELCRGGALSTDCFKSGDARVNEHPGLVAAHILWLRQHNRMAQELAHANPHWSDEKIYQEARKIVGAMVQHITYKEFLPIVLGSEVMRLFDLEPQKKGFYKSYNPKINANPASSFGSAAFRFGHSLVQPSMVRFDRFHRPMDNNVSLHDELTNPSNIWSMGAVDRLVLGMVNQPIQKRDEYITEELTNHLFQTPHFDFGMDLAAINIQRGRDHGVPSYTTFREPCGLTPMTEFEDLFRVMPARTVRKLQTVYRHVDDIDLFTGGMAERPVVGGLVGPTFACIIAQQFSNLRKGDRFWYENGGFESSFTPAQLQQIRRISFAQILCRTLDNIDSVQPFAFLSSDNPDNDRIPCNSGLMNNFDLSPWEEISDNDIAKSDKQNILTQTPKPKPSTTTTTKPSKQNRPTIKTPTALPLVANIKEQNNKHPKLNKTDNSMTLTQTNINNIRIDDKLDFKNKSKRYEDTDRQDDRQNRPTKTNYNDYDNDDVQSVQSVVINNAVHKRPHKPQYNRPIAVTENIDKFTYLINYVPRPRPTQSWRQTTRRPYTDRDVVKVTYQSYDDTYRRPNRPYDYNNRRDERPSNYDYRQNKHTTKTDDYHSSARSNDEILDSDETSAKKSTTTENVYKLVTFGYVGTYKGTDATKSDFKLTDKDKNHFEVTDKDNSDFNPDSVRKDFVTNDKDSSKTPKLDIDDKTKLSTFYHYDTVTKPFTMPRSTRRDDEMTLPDSFGPSNKYYYASNVLHRYPGIDSTLTNKPTTPEEDKEIIKENYNNPGHPNMDVQERSADKVVALEEDSPKIASRTQAKKKPPMKANSKTPTVDFQVMPSEISPTHWAVYDENENLPESLHHKMPSIQADPYALKEMPRPMSFGLRMKKRRPNS